MQLPPLIDMKRICDQWNCPDINSIHISQDGSVTASVLCDVVHDLTKHVPKMQGVRVVDIVTNLDAEKSQIKPITGITQLHNFSFDVNGITVWKAYGIGEGNRISWDNIGTTELRTNLLVKVDWTIAAPQLLEKEVMAQEEELVEPIPQKKQKKNSINQPYDCPKELLKLNVHWSNTSLLVSGRKVDPLQAADEMRQLQEEGKYVFSRKDYLTGQQITAYFSRLALKDRKTDLEDFRSAEEETNKRCLKQEILDSVSL
ncbi:unnamed protein product [Mytilus coruscus]|uniref:Uncharacterized protein n=1 Tax=Mytilus coruscus TaxID=42192 RepID=A0A6J8EMV9_MYTCO|nr:unnamed protein product [Mytilus coruscus]